MNKLSFVLVLFMVTRSLSAQQTMNNNAVIKLCNAGLSDQLIVATINASPGNYDISADGVIALANGGASEKVISALVRKVSPESASLSIPSGAPAAPPTPSASNTPPAAVSALPAGIDEVGVYFQIKNGTWVALTPEIVNFKTGGVLKSIATSGIVRGDLNGHIGSRSAKTTLTFPLTLAVYVPEGTAITEYQLLRLRLSGNSREFRSVTGGVFHVSGGASRDTVEFTSTKLAPRVYQIKVEFSLGKGEYGLLPPGAVGSSNLGRSGKIYSISVPE